MPSAARNGVARAPFRKVAEKAPAGGAGFGALVRSVARYCASPRELSGQPRREYQNKYRVLPFVFSSEDK